jgi:hypothetical protein
MQRQITKYKKVTIEEAQENPEYWQVMRHIYERASNIIIKGKDGKLGKTHWSDIIKQTERSLNFIKEPLDDVYKEHAEKIKLGKWLELNFSEPEFVRNIYKALRLKLINPDQLATAVMLHDAREQFKDENGRPPEIKQYKMLDEKGPYQPHDLPLVVKPDVKKINENLQKIPETENCYFSVVFPKVHEFAFINALVTFVPLYFKGDARLTIPLFKNLIHNITNREKNPRLFVDLAKDSGDLNANFVSAKKELWDLLREKELDDKVQKIPQFLASHFLLVNIVLLQHLKLPMMLTIYPDFKENNPNSGLLCINFSTPSALRVLQDSIYGEHASNPFFVAGQFLPRLVRELDENPRDYGLKQQARPIELSHPDLVTQQKTHELMCYPFTNMIHDYGYHLFNNSANAKKTFLRYLRRLLEKEKGFPMSKAIYELSDMDGGHHTTFIRENKTYWSLLLFYILQEEFFILDEYTDERLLFCCDMIINRNEWKNYNSILPGQCDEFLKKEENRRNKFNIVSGILNEIIKGSPNQSNLFYIVAYRIRENPDYFKVLNELEQKIGLKNIFEWERNGNIHFRSKYSPSKVALFPFANLYSELFKLIPNPGVQVSKAPDKTQKSKKRTFAEITTTANSPHALFSSSIAAATTGAATTAAAAAPTTVASTAPTTATPTAPVSYKQKSLGL